MKEFQRYSIHFIRYQPNITHSRARDKKKTTNHSRIFQNVLKARFVYPFLFTHFPIQIKRAFLVEKGK